VIGVVVACVAWPVVTRVSSAPRWLFFRLAVLVTLVLLLPDLYILHMGEPAKGVAVLMVMHVTIALVTYNLLVHLAPARPAAGGAPAGGPPVSEPVPAGPVSASPVSAGPAAAGPGAPVAEQAARGRHRQAR
jgi:hypothetical protein